MNARPWNSLPMIKRLLLVGVPVALVVAGLVGFNLYRSDAQAEAFAARTPPALTVSVGDARTVTWRPTVDAIGTLDAVNGVDLTVETAGIVAEILFEPNRRVEKGDMLLRLDEAVELAELEASRTAADLDETVLSRARELGRRGVNTQSDLDSAEASAAGSRADVDRRQALLEQRQLRAPFSGTIGLQRVDTGEYLAPGTIVATLQDLSVLRADFTVPEQELARLRIGQEVEATLTDQDVALTGTIVGIDPRVNAATRLASVRAEMDNARTDVLPGQFARIRVRLPDEDGVVAVPQSALVTSLYGDHVFAVESQPTEEADAAGDASGEAMETLVARQVFVTAGRRDGDLVEIVDGLDGGERVVAAGQNRLSGGARVTIAEPDAGRRGIPGGEGDSNRQAAR